MRKYAALVLSLMIVASASAQDIFNMPASGTVTNTSNDCWVYDDGGAANDYGTYVDSYMILTPVNSNLFYNSLHLEYAMEAPSQTKIEIYNNYNGALLFRNSASDTVGTIDITICARSIRVYFHTDSEAPQGDGFALHLGVCDTCPDRVQWVSSEVLPNNQALVKWDTVIGGSEYLVRLYSSSFGSVTLAVQGDSLMLPVVSPAGDTIFPVRHCDTISASVYTPCDTIATSCSQCISPAYTGWRQCLCPKPSITTFNRIDNDTDGLRNDYMVRWSEPADTIQWTVVLVNFSTGQEVSRVTTDTNFYLFENLDTCYSYAVTVYCDCHDDPYHDDNPPCKAAVQYIYGVNCSGCLIGVSSVYANIDYVTITLANDTTSLVASIYLGATLIQTNTIRNGTTTFNNLDRATQYTIIIYDSSGTISCDTTFTAVTLDNCIAYYDLHSPLTYATYGYSAANPYLYHGVIDNGEYDVTSRHTVNYDTSATDPNTGDILRVIPYGAEQSVRLGNWTGGESEALTYTYLVDANVNDLLLLRYAVVLNDPSGSHPPERRPSFTLVILDSTGVEIDSICGKADFVAGENTDDWNVYQGDILWKNWTTVGFDVSPYHNRQIKVRLTTKDCLDGNSKHFGYAYFTFECTSKYIAAVNCGKVDSSVFFAPEGFSYRWYNVNDESTVLSTSNRLVVYGEATQYFYCIVSNLENPDCQFRLNAMSGNRYPNADFTYDYTFQNCAFYVQFHNGSYVSADSLGMDTIANSCETAQWLFHSGIISTTYHTSYIYSQSGDYIVRLVSGIANNSCTDTIELLIHLVPPPLDSVSIVGNTSICLGSSTTLTATSYGQYLWNNGYTTQSIAVTPSDTTLYSVSVIDTFGCSSTDEHLVQVKASYYDINVYDTICEKEYYAPEGRPLTEEGVYHLYLTTKEGCDSVIYLHLTVLTNCNNIFVPNAFTPNEQSNNTFRPYSADDVEMRFEIYNRYGAMVFESNTPNEGWDGTFRGNPCPQGVYVWRLVYRYLAPPSAQQVKYGTVMLIY
jgi:gliding motility-associated-like protein